MSLLDDARAEMLAAKREFGDFLYDQEGDWVREQGRVIRHVHCRYSVKQGSTSPAAVADLEATARSAGVAYADMRVVKIHPDDSDLEVGMVMSVQSGSQWVPSAWDGGRLEIVARSQKGKLSGQRTYMAVLRR